MEKLKRRQKINHKLKKHWRYIKWLKEYLYWRKG